MYQVKTGYITVVRVSIIETLLPENWLIMSQKHKWFGYDVQLALAITGHVTTAAATLLAATAIWLGCFILDTHEPSCVLILADT